MLQSMWHLFWHFFLTFYMACVLTLYLAVFMASYLTYVWHSVQHSLWHSVWHFLRVQPCSTAHSLARCIRSWRAASGACDMEFGPHSIRSPRYGVSGPAWPTASGTKNMRATLQRSRRARRRRSCTFVQSWRPGDLDLPGGKLKPRKAVPGHKNIKGKKIKRMRTMVFTLYVIQFQELWKHVFWSFSTGR